MKVICSGMPKTGTKTIASALRLLGYNVYDFEEQFWFLGHDLKRIMDTGWTTEDIQRMFKDVDAITDVPACILWEELYKAFPDAKVVHTERASDEEWSRSYVIQMNSMKNQRFVRIMMMLSPTAQRLRRFLNGSFRLGVSGKDNLPWKFSTTNAPLARLRNREHNTRVRQVVSSDRILHFKLSEGWGPLCTFLGVPEPSQPFPHRNKGGSITEEVISKSYVFDQIKKEIGISLSVIVLVIALVYYFFL